MTLEVNRKLFTKEGVIGRRDFFINSLYVNLITSPIWMIIYFLVLNPNAAESETIIKQASFLGWLCGIVSGALIIPSCYKRLNDINGYEDKKFNQIFISVYILCLLLLIKMEILCILAFGCILFLIFKAGKITSLIPKKVEDEFNWGAYFGTWIWGLVNKSYITLWMLAIGFTPLGGIFSLICGFKGNEWAAKNRDWNSVQEFREAQNKQTIIFVILSIVLIPILIFILCITAIGGAAAFLINDAKNNPERAEKAMARIEKTIVDASTMYFSSYKITANNNIFYIEPLNWKYKNFTERKRILEMAANTSKIERNKRGFRGLPKEKELQRTKIYNADNGELLAEYSFDNSIYEKTNIKVSEVVAAKYSAYRFYEPSKKQRKGNI